MAHSVPIEAIELILGDNVRVPTELLDYVMRRVAGGFGLPLNKVPAERIQDALAREAPMVEPPFPLTGA